MNKEHFGVFINLHSEHHIERSWRFTDIIWEVFKMWFNRWEEVQKRAPHERHRDKGFLSEIHSEHFFSLSVKYWRDSGSIKVAESMWGQSFVKGMNICFILIIYLVHTFNIIYDETMKVSFDKYGDTFCNFVCFDTNFKRGIFINWVWDNQRWNDSYSNIHIGYASNTTSIVIHNKEIKVKVIRAGVIFDTFLLNYEYYFPEDSNWVVNKLKKGVGLGYQKNQTNSFISQLKKQKIINKAIFSIDKKDRNGNGLIVFGDIPDTILSNYSFTCNLGIQHGGVS